ncbi:MAG: hypothetical protein KatS3mg104_0212 [Phycisphaerae bacterium]|jgi:hypothetical protein|nr:MAG: hypothetical protein KatS3mg104_0212 [Phycisphaerae bacterium]
MARLVCVCSACTWWFYLGDAHDHPYAQALSHGGGNCSKRPNSSPAANTPERAGDRPIPTACVQAIRPLSDRPPSTMILGIPVGSVRQSKVSRGLDDDSIEFPKWPIRWSRVDIMPVLTRGPDRDTSRARNRLELPEPKLSGTTTPLQAAAQTTDSEGHRRVESTPWRSSLPARTIAKA